MDVPEFVEAVQSFATKPIDVNLDSGRLIAEIFDDILEIELHTELGVLYCVESGLRMPAGQWITRRLGRFELLAKALLDRVPEDPKLIPVRADVVDVLEKDPDATSVTVDDALHSVRALVSSPLAGMTKVVYLTSDAGEGKTSVIDCLARSQARLYLEKKVNWLLLPVPLGGRPFIRLDDVIIGSLANRLRFPYYYYDSVIELVKLNALVLALDGFEEMFVVTRTGEAVSSLGKLVSRLDSKGRLLIAARSAYYEYRDFEAQAKLFKSIHRDAEVSFAKVALKRWSRNEFLRLAELEELEDGEQLYNTLAKNLNPQHPLLTRAVLARKLIQTYCDSEDKGKLLQRLSKATGERYFEEFVSGLIEREVYEKWLDRSGEAAKPLLTVEGHHALLTAIAEEMWQSNTTALNGDLLEDITEVTVDAQLNQSPEIVRQARERITQHALLTQQRGARLYEFDHEEFRNFYLGRHLGTLMRNRDVPALKSLLNVNDLPELSVRVGVSRFSDAAEASSDGSLATGVVEIIEVLCKLAMAGRPSSFLRANAGDIVLAVLGTKGHEQAVEVHDLHFDTDRIVCYSLVNVTFRSSYFDRFYYNPVVHKNIRFVDCTVSEFIIQHKVTGNGISFDNSSLPVVLCVRYNHASEASSSPGDERRIYDPVTVKAVLRSAGFEFTEVSDAETPVISIPEEDLGLRIVDRVVRYFQRATSISEPIFIQRLGTWWPEFEDRVLPALLENGILEEIPTQGARQYRRYRLGIGFEKLEQARRAAHGDFERFIEEFSKKV